MRDENNLTEQLLCDSNAGRQHHPRQPSHDLPLTETEESLRLLQAILAHVSEGALLVQPSTGQILYTTLSLDRKFGYEPDELIGQHITVLNAPGTAKATFDRIVEGMEEKGAWQGEINNQKKDGSCFWTWIDVFTFEHSSYGPVWVSVRRDLTEERRTKELRKFVRKLKGDFNDLVETLPHGIQLTDASWTITFANSALHEMYECDAGELVGGSVLDFVPSDRRQEKIERLRTLVAQKPKPVPIFEQKVTRSGRVFDVRMDWGYRLDARGRVLGFASLITDVTASTRVEARCEPGDALHESSGNASGATQLARQAALHRLHEIARRLFSADVAVDSRFGTSDDLGPLLGHSEGDDLGLGKEPPQPRRHLESTPF